MRRYTYLRHSGIKRKAKSRPTRVTKDGRLILSATDWQKMKQEMWKDAPLLCHICHQRIMRYEDFQPDHVEPRGMGGGRRSDAPENILPSHSWCNFQKGSKRNLKLSAREGA